MPSYIRLFLFSFVLGFIFSLISRKSAVKLGLYDSNKKIPYTGGISLFFSFTIPYLLFNLIKGVSLPLELIWIIIFSLLLLLIEFIDDLKDFSLRTRIIIQIIFVSLFLLYGKRIQIYFLVPWLNYLLSFLWIIGITNTFNLLDISDGLCGGVSLIVGLSFLVVSIINGNILLIGLFISLCGALCAFLFFNLPPAKIFMGNSGSHLLGFMFATLSIYGDYATLDNPLALLLPLLILAFPLIDTFFLIIVRFKKGIMPLKKSSDHIFLSLLSSGHSVGRALFVIYIVTLSWAMSGVCITVGLNPFFLVYIILSILLTFKLIIKIRFSH